MTQTVERITEVRNDFLYFFRRVNDMNRRDRRLLLRLLCDGYANANFGYEGADQTYNLDEGDLLKMLADQVCKGLGINAFDHYALEEVYNHPVSKDETPEQRAKALEDRDYKHEGVSSISRLHVAYVLASQILAFYDKGKKKDFWQRVEKELHRKVNDALAKR